MRIPILPTLPSLQINGRLRDWWKKFESISLSQKTFAGSLLSRVLTSMKPAHTSLAIGLALVSSSGLPTHSHSLSSMAELCISMEHSRSLKWDLFYTHLVCDTQIVWELREREIELDRDR